MFNFSFAPVKFAFGKNLKRRYCNVPVSCSMQATWEHRLAPSFSFRRLREKRRKVNNCLKALVDWNNFVRYNMPNLFSHTAYAFFRLWVFRLRLAKVAKQPQLSYAPQGCFQSLRLTSSLRDCGHRLSTAQSLRLNASMTIALAYTFSF